MFYKDQMKIKIEMDHLVGYSLERFVNENNSMPPYFFYDKYKVIELDSDGFNFEKAKLKRMIKDKVIPDDFIDDDNFITPYFEFRFLGNVFDFEHTTCQCGLFKVNN